MSGFFRFFLALLLLSVLVLPSCLRPRNAEVPVTEAVTEQIQEAPGAADRSGFAARLSNVMRNAELPPDLSRRIQAASVENPAFILDLLVVLEGSPYLRELVDNHHPLPTGFVPPELVPLTGGSFGVTRDGMLLRRSAAVALEEMAAAARADGVVLTVGSAYRSFAHQTEVHNRLIQQMGREEALRVSARPGHSEHQTGLAVDFAPISDAFAETAAGRWVDANAYRFGWSLSYPDGYEHITGFRWESWHFRYVGRNLVAFINNYFDGIQHFALRFLHEWNLYTP